MDILAASLRYWIAYKLNTDPGWENVRLDLIFPILVAMRILTFDS
jgi:5'-3' exoribonuclease 2